MKSIIKAPPMPKPHVCKGEFYPDTPDFYTAEQIAARDAQWQELVGPVVEALDEILNDVGRATSPARRFEARAALRAITEEQE